MNNHSLMSYGLCANVSLVFDANEVVRTVLQEMTAQFVKANLNPTTPFGRGRYEVCLADGTQHRDPARLKWVEEHVAQGNDGQSPHLLEFYTKWLTAAKAIAPRAEVVISDFVTNWQS